MFQIFFTWMQNKSGDYILGLQPNNKLRVGSEVLRMAI